MTSPAPSAADLAPELRQLVHKAITAAVPREGIVSRGTRPDSDYTWPQPTPAAGFAAAQKVIGLARQAMHRYAVQMRGEGTSWAQLADLLDIPWSEGYSRVERAFEQVAETEGMSSNWSGPRVYWYCGGPVGCAQHITDHGPYDGHPANTQDGHDPGCVRVAREIAAHEREQEAAERRGRVMDEADAQLPAGSFARDTAARARYVVTHGGQYRGWSTSESLAVALALRDDAALKLHGYSTRAAAIQRVGRGLGDTSEEAEATLALIRAAVTGER